MSSQDLCLIGFDYSHGSGLINTAGIMESLERKETRELPVGERVSGSE